MDPQLSAIQEESDKRNDEVGELSSLLQETATSIMRTILFFKDRGVIPYEYLCFLQRLSRDLTKPPPQLDESDIYSVEVDETGDWANVTHPDQLLASPQIEQPRTYIERSSNTLTPRKTRAKSFDTVKPRRLFAATSSQPLRRDVNAFATPAGRFQSTSGPINVTQGCVPCTMSVTSPARLDATPEVVARSRSNISPTRREMVPQMVDLNRSSESPAWRNATRTIAPLSRSPARMDVNLEAVTPNRSTVSPERMNVTSDDMVLRSTVSPAMMEPIRAPGGLNSPTVSPAWRNATQTTAPLSRSPARMEVTPEALTRNRSTLSPTRMNVIPDAEVRRSSMSPARMQPIRGPGGLNSPAISPAWRNTTQPISPLSRSPARMDVTPEAMVRRSTISPARMEPIRRPGGLNSPAISPAWGKTTRMNATPSAYLRNFIESPARMNSTRNVGPSNRSTRMDVTPESIALSRSLGATQASSASQHTPRNVTRVYNSDSYRNMKCDMPPLYYLVVSDLPGYEEFYPEFESTRIKSGDTFIK